MSRAPRPIVTPTANLRRSVPNSGFTLMELLVVIGIVSLLASLLLPALAGAKASAYAAKCKSNLRQLGLGLAMYTDDFGCYPVYSTERGDRLPPLWWYEAMEPYTKSKWWQPLYLCPSFKAAAYADPRDRRYAGTPDYRNPTVYAYGYNVWGVGFDLGPYGLGLGGRTLLPSPPPLPANEVTAPSDMIAVGDAYASGYSERGYGLIGDQPWIGSHLKGSVGQPDQRWEAAARHRHKGRLQVVFCDAHVESVKLQELLLEKREQNLKRWNNDHQPHLDGYRY